MAKILVTCNDHGDVETTSDEVIARVCVNNAEGSYVFRCPADGRPIAKLADPRTIEKLIAAGCRLDRWSLPKELDERRDGRPLTHDDILDFHQFFDDIDLRPQDIIGEANPLESEIRAELITRRKRTRVEAAEPTTPPMLKSLGARLKEHTESLQESDEEIKGKLGEYLDYAAEYLSQHTEDSELREVLADFQRDLYNWFDVPYTEENHGFEGRDSGRNAESFE